MHNHTALPPVRRTQERDPEPGAFRRDRDRGALFGNVCLRRRCGRIGARGQSVDDHFKDEKQAVSLFFHLARRRLRRGYPPR
ncbi:WGR domain-containing protein [Ensifer sp. KUDG1]|uniref:WGR domain-containing protein n=1 Tax=Ensifer sp. KUDG1 TaxID=3373919 RepID=UPI003D1E8557